MIHILHHIHYNALHIYADGFIGGVQVTLELDSDCHIDLGQDAMHAAYKTNDDNITTSISAGPSEKVLEVSGCVFNEKDVINVITYC